MKKSETVTVYTQVYNTKQYLVQCIDSVLSQTYSNLEYILVDNGCTDGSSEILIDFAQKDNRIKLIRNEKNQQGFWKNLIFQLATGAYFTLIDSDDWWEPDYLERLLTIAKENNLDIVCTGNIFHFLSTGKQGLRHIEKQLLITRSQFSTILPIYYQFFRTSWGKLVRMDIFQKVMPEAVPTMVYGGDTADSFQLLRHSNRIEIDTSILYHYRAHPKSVSHQYNPKRFETDVYLYNDVIDFLSSFGPVSIRNRNFLQSVYSYAIIDTTEVIENSNLSPSDKLREYHAIATHPLTLTAYQQCKDESAVKSKTGLILKVLKAGEALKEQNNTDLRSTMQKLLPQCGLVISAYNAEMFLKDTKLLQALFQDDSDVILQMLLNYMEKNQGVKKYAIPKMIQTIAVKNPLLCQIDDAVFLRKYSGIYQMVWRGEHFIALDEMTGLLLKNKVSRGQETFLQLYISLSAVLEQAPAFVFGKLQLAQFYLRQNRIQECRIVVAELEEMGVENEQMDMLRPMSPT